MTFVPIPAKMSAGTYRVQPGDTITSICSRLEQPLANYPDLIAANLHRPLTDHGVPDGQSVVFSSLHEGDSLNVPAAWSEVPATRWPFTGRLAGLEGAPGMLGDAVTDGFIALYPYSPAGGTKAQYDANVHVLTSWWRDEHQDGALPKSAADWAPYATAAAAWHKNVGSKITPEQALAIDFGSPPWFQLFQLIQSNPSLAKALLATDRDKINTALATAIYPGQFPKVKKPVFWKALTDQQFNSFGQMGWLANDWASTAGLRWDLLPFDQINWAGYPGINLDKWIVSEIKRLTGKTVQQDIDISIPPILNCPQGQIPVGDKCGSLKPIPAGGCPAGSWVFGGQCFTPGDALPIPEDKPCPPQGVKKNGTCDCTEKMGPSAIFDEVLWLCVDCGPNTKPYQKGSKACDCIDGYEPAPSGAEGSGCVKKAEPGTGAGTGTGTGLQKAAPVESSGWKTAAMVIGALAVGYGVAKATKAI